MEVFRQLRIAAIIVVACSFGAAVHANGISVTSTSLETSGGWLEKWLVGSGDSEADEYFSAFGSFSFMATGIGASLSNHVSSLHQWEQAWSGSDAFNLYLASASSPSDFPTTDGYGGLSGQGISFYSSATTRFHAANSRLELHLFGDADYNYEDYEQDLQASLRDLTSGDLLLFKDDLDGPFRFSEQFDYVFSAVPGHEYELTLYGGVESFDSKNVKMNLHASLASVPEASATFEMVLLGLFGILTLQGVCGSPLRTGMGSKNIRANR